MANGPITQGGHKKENLAISDNILDRQLSKMPRYQFTMHKFTSICHLCIITGSFAVCFQTILGLYFIMVIIIIIILLSRNTLFSHFASAVGLKVNVANEIAYRYTLFNIIPQKNNSISQLGLRHYYAVIYTLQIG